MVRRQKRYNQMMDRTYRLILIFVAELDEGRKVNKVSLFKSTEMPS